MPTDADGRGAGVLCALGSVTSVQVGQAFGKSLIAAAGASGVVVLRLGFAAVLLLLLRRPKPPADRRTLLLVLAWGTAIAGMNTIYLALVYLPLGIAATLQFAAGPFAMALLGARRPGDVLWAVLAGAGVALLYAPGSGPLPAAGVLLALLSGASMAAYLALSRRAGAADGDGTLLVWAVLWAAALWTPAALLAGGPPLEPRLLLLGLLLALVSAVLPYRLDFAALRRLPPRTVAVLVSLEPVVGAAAGAVLLGELLTAPQWLAIACIAAASIGAVGSGRPKAPFPAP
ncbi:inner membrane transporter RhtA [Murinocardiopsis flavida]|uniref:Inner membrane transporter RhtA n=1 Tax=Murinocardiopsis flavida TaxID=645275 RepID=A0A2P8DFP9_9ACTN|nr:EamA family transporter [Murinocardiopsis flavida]PSK96017.1 inner membrane transporter RhtA [Murinocardiopsis flavida]